jgi:hypothetical protein
MNNKMYKIFNVREGEYGNEFVLCDGCKQKRGDMPGFVMECLGNAPDLPCKDCEGTEGTVYCHKCSEAGGAEFPVFHPPPKCQ